MQLPGGLPDAEGKMRRTARLEEATGHVERLLLSAEEPGSIPERVTAALGAVLHVQGVGEGDAVARALSVGDRRWLVLELLARVAGPVRWHTSECSACQQPFDVPVDRSELPLPSVAEGYPATRVELSTGPCEVRVLTGEDEEAAIDIDASDAATITERLAARATARDDLTPDDVAAVSMALDELGPTVVTSVATACPSCSEDAVLDIDPLREVGRGGDRLVDDVHRLASTYHWSEHDILSLPTRRRRRYLARIDAARGVRA